MGNVLVSIVAPVYNIERYLPTFIDSVLKQTFSDWELLLVDDGSSDRSRVICDEYSRKDGRIRVIHKSNGGVSSARNAGLKEMKGEWVLIADPDDEFPLDSFETMLTYVSDEIDLLSASYIWYKNGEKVVPSKQSHDIDMTRDEFVSLMGIIPQPRNLDRRIYNKVYRASIIRDNSIYFPEDIHYREDILYNYLYLNKCVRKVRCLSYEMYIYYMRDTGAALSLQRHYTWKSGGRFLAMAQCYDILKRMGASDATVRRMQDEVLYTYKRVIKLIAQSGKGKKDCVFYFTTLCKCCGLWNMCLIGTKAFFRRFKKSFLL